MPISKKRPRKVWMPSDFLSQSQIKQMNGKVETSYMYTRLDLVKSIEEIKELPKEKAQDYLINVLQTHKTRDLKKHWGINDHQYYKVFLPEYQIAVKKGMKPYVDNTLQPTQPRQPRQYNRSEMFVQNNNEAKESDIVVAKLFQDKIEELETKIQEMENKEESQKITFGVNEILNGKELSNELTDIAVFFDKKEGQEFHVNITITKK